MNEHEEPRRGLFRSRSGLALLGFLAIAGYFVWTEHRAHAAQALPYLPYLLLLLCPLLHIFHGHGGHGGHGHDGEKDDHGRKTRAPEQQP